MAALIHSFAHYLPGNMISSDEIEERLITENPNIRISRGVIEQLTKIGYRPIADSDAQASDLASRAGNASLEKSLLKKTDVDLLIYASASHDITEPATANIVQTKLELSCPAFDIKNACNSFLNGLEVAHSFVCSNEYKNVLVTTGEVPSRLLKYNFKDKQAFKSSFASFTLGDAGGAAVVSKTNNSSNVLYKKFYTNGEFWKAASVLGGGSMYPFDMEKFSFYGNPNKLREGFLQFTDGPLKEMLNMSGYNLSQVKAVFAHQVASAMTSETINFLNLPKEKVVRTVEKHGNLASASLPVAISQALEDNVISTGNVILILGLASGISGALWLLKVE